jgi:hypothetical protein
VRQDWQATRSEEGHVEGGKGNGDNDDTTINIRWEVGRGCVTKGGVEGNGDSDGDEDGYGGGKKGGGRATATATARWWRATKRVMSMVTREAGKPQQRGQR